MIDTQDILQLFVDNFSGHDNKFSSDLVSLLNRLELWPNILLRQQQEEILRLVSISPEWLAEERQRFIGDSSIEDHLQKHNWSIQDLDIHLALPEALRLFAEYRFSPGLEERFLSANGGHDQVIYSLLRVRDPGLAQELWIRYEEGEKVFSELAAEFGEGPEASTNGLFGPVPLGSIQPPQLQSILRSLKVSKVTPPTQLGEWTILVRLEQITQAKFDEKMRNFLLDQEMNNFLNQRVSNLLLGKSLESLEYVSSS